MTLPSVFLAFVVSTLYGAAFHLLVGGKLWRLPFYVLLSWIGFAVGQWVAMSMEWTFLSIGPLHLGVATISSLLILTLGHWLSLIDVRPTADRPKR